MEGVEGVLYDLLKSLFGYASFRPLQLEAMKAVLGGQDVLCCCPTGSGKSLMYQLPPMVSNQLTVVVTPLLALAKDQIENANDRDIEAATWSSLTSESLRAALARDIVSDSGSLRLLYTTPESLQTPRLLELLKVAHEGGRLCCLAVDEAHACVSWGTDFRPSYLALGTVRAALTGLPCLAVTATAPEGVRSSIIKILRLQNPTLLVSSANRPELRFSVVHKELLGGQQSDVIADIVRYIQNRQGESGIVYCRLRKSCDEVAAALLNAGIAAAAYHAGLPPQRRNRIQDDWKSGGLDVVVATVAFGMGVDKSDVRYVVHFDAPETMEGFYQEAGRAGRDGMPAESVLYISHEDLANSKRLEKPGREGGAAAVAEYALNAGCRRAALLRRFGESGPKSCIATDRGNQLCDYCADPHRVTHSVELATASAAGGRLESDNNKPPSPPCRKRGNEGSKDEPLLDEEPPSKKGGTLALQAPNGVPWKNKTVPHRRSSFKTTGSAENQGNVKGIYGLSSSLLTNDVPLRSVKLPVRQRRPFVAPRRTDNELPR